jgi:hypothetical protein
MKILINPLPELVEGREDITETAIRITPTASFQLPPSC